MAKDSSLEFELESSPAAPKKGFSLRTFSEMPVIIVYIHLIYKTGKTSEQGYSIAEQNHKHLT